MEEKQCISADLYICDAKRAVRHWHVGRPSSTVTLFPTIHPQKPAPRPMPSFDVQHLPVCLILLESSSHRRQEARRHAMHQERIPKCKSEIRPASEASNTARGTPTPISFRVAPDIQAHRQPDASISSTPDIAIHACLLGPLTQPSTASMTRPNKSPPRQQVPITKYHKLTRRGIQSHSEGGDGSAGGGAEVVV